MSQTSVHGEWSSRWAFILAAAGSAVGLGNIWKFPYITAEYGGGAFVITYLFFVLMIGLPIMMAEILVGKCGKHSPINTLKIVTEATHQSKFWRIIGWMGTLCGFLILSYYSVIGGWTIAYVFKVGSGIFSHIDTLHDKAMIAAHVTDVFKQLTANPQELILWHTVFMTLTMLVVLGGVQGGLEKAILYMMPSLFIVLFILVGYAMSTEKFLEGIAFMFKINFSALLFSECGNGYCKFNGQGILAAMGQTFFSLSIGMGAIMAYGAYLPKHVSISQAALVVVLSDTLVAILAGIIIFPIAFSNGLEVNQCPGLVFITLPIAFGHMPYGIVFGTLFFILLVLAAWTSSISILEPPVAWMVETGKFTRFSATLVCGILSWALGLLTVFSFNILSDFKPLAELSMFKDATLFDIFDFLTSNILLPLGGMLIAIFVAWFLPKAVLLDALEMEANNWIYRFWYFTLRYITPICVGLIFLNSIGVLT
jgi:NSS family neurotransmitter:Na+ symporter